MKLLTFSRRISNSIVRNVLSQRDNAGKPLLLEDFVLRSKVITMYRDVVRIVYKTHEKADLMDYVRHEFKTSGIGSDISHKRYLYSTGMDRINQTLSMMGLLSEKFKQ